MVFAIRRGSRSFFEGEFKDGLYSSWPWFLENLRPSGFLGRAFAKRLASLYKRERFGLTWKENPKDWNDLELMEILINEGDNLPGNFILGNGSALDQFQKHKIETAKGFYRHITSDFYPSCPSKKREQYGSSTGGEQPKFLTSVCDTPEAEPRAVMVKFSPPTETPSGRRWADLLYAEHIANQTLKEAGFTVSRTRTFQRERRVFLESERFDRIGPSGRRGVVTLRLLDAAHLGASSGTWADYARKLHADKWITARDSHQIMKLHCFGELIANTDMHWENLSFFLPDKSPFPLAPVYDMLPMRFRPESTGEVLEHTFEPSLPKPEDHDAWSEMHPHALSFWQRIVECETITDTFKAIAKEAIPALKAIHKIADV